MTHDEIVNYQYCTGVPYQDFEYCYSELTPANLNMLMLSISAIVISCIILAVMIGRESHPKSGRKLNDK